MIRGLGAWLWVSHDTFALNGMRNLGFAIVDRKYMDHTLYVLLKKCPIVHIEDYV